MCKTSIRLKEHENVPIRKIYVLFWDLSLAFFFFLSKKKKSEDHFFFYKFKPNSFKTFAICGYMNYE